MTLKNAVRPALCAAVLGLLALASTASFAATNTATFHVNVTVVANCTISASDLNFPDYNGTVTTKSNASIAITCTNGLKYNVGLNGGGAGSVTARLMTDGTHTLGYSLFSDSFGGTNWGNTVGTDTVAGTGTGSNAAFTVYGQIPANQYAPTGSYSDTITATITY